MKEEEVLRCGRALFGVGLKDGGGEEGVRERDRCVEKHGVGVASCSFRRLPKELSAQARGSLKASPVR